MNFKALLGIALIIFGFALLFGDPAKWQWPMRLGPYAVDAIAFCTTWLPYSGIMAIVFGLAVLMMLKKY